MRHRGDRRGSSPRHGCSSGIREEKKTLSTTSSKRLPTPSRHHIPHPLYRSLDPAAHCVPGNTLEGTGGGRGRGRDSESYALQIFKGTVSEYERGGRKIKIECSRQCCRPLHSSLASFLDAMPCAACGSAFGSGFSSFSRKSLPLHVALVTAYLAVQHVLSMLLFDGESHGSIHSC